MAKNIYKKMVYVQHKLLIIGLFKNYMNFNYILVIFCVLTSLGLILHT